LVVLGVLGWLGAIIITDFVVLASMLRVLAQELTEARQARDEQTGAHLVKFSSPPEPRRLASE